MPAIACTIVTGEPLPYPPRADQFVLYGEVTGYVRIDDAWCDKPECGSAWGVKLSVAATVFTPDRRYRTAEFYEFSNESDCSLQAASREEVQRRFPRGTKLEIAAPRLHSAAGADRVLQLESGVLDGSLVARLPSSVALERQATSEYNYRYSRIWGDEVRFELRKDFVRLRDAGVSQRAAILRRLAYYDGRPMDGSATRATAFQRILRDYPVTDTSALHAIEAAFDASEILAFDGEKELEYAIGTLAQQGDAGAQAAIGWQFFTHGEYEKAIVWLDLAASAGDPLAEVYAGLAYRRLAEEYTDEDDESLEVGPTPHARFASLANDRLNHAGRAARRLLATGDPAGAVIVATMYATRSDDGLSFSSREAEHYACIGSYVRPIWLASFDQEMIAREIEERLQSSCDEVLGGWTGGDDRGLGSARAR